jgi:hypothetical protein
LLLQYIHFRTKNVHCAVLLQKWRKTWSYSTPQVFEKFQQMFPDFQGTYQQLVLRLSMINKVATTHCSFLRLQIKREDIIDKCRECDKDRSIYNFKGCFYRVKPINLHRLQIK